MTTENNLSENEEKKNPHQVSQDISENQVSYNENPQKEDTEYLEEYAEEEVSLANALKEMESIINTPNAGEYFKRFNILKDKASHYIYDETEDKKHEHIEAGNAPENFSYEHPSQAKFSALVNIFKEKYNKFQKGQEEEQKENLKFRQSIIERLKNLYTHSEPGINLFKSIREIKEDWAKAGQVAKSEFKILNNNYFHHLSQFYQMLDLNKEFLEQEYRHNLEKRKHIIARAKELENEPVIQKALNELQYLHKLWKEEAEPVAEEFREKTWEEFKEVSNKIHERKSELSDAIKKEQNANLEKKNQIINEIKTLSEPTETPNHNYWQNAIKRVENLRADFLKIGSVPRKLSNKNWNDFKTTLRGFNTIKNNYYKSLKDSQQANLEEKLKLIQTAQEYMNNEEWDISVPLFKKLQEDWKKIGHVPKSMTNKIWEEFRNACNAFFNNYREKNNISTNNWKENYKNKKMLLDELKEVSNEEGSIARIEQIKTAWNNVGKVPKDKISINSEFNKTLREKLKINKINELELKEEGLSENQLTEKARKIKNQISDLEADIVKLENNLSFFNNQSRENPLLKDTYSIIDEKKAHLDTLKRNLHSIISGE